MDSVILHADLNNFYASVECVENPKLKLLPLAVCGDPENRHGIVLAKNQLAKTAGVKTGETIRSAQKKCGRKLVVVKPHFNEYVFFSKKVREIYYSFTDRIETFGLDECWLDVTGSQKLFGSGEEIADKIRDAVRTKLGLTVSVGVSFSKVFAKLGSDMKKPDATTVISRENYKKKVWPLPVEEMLFIGKHTAEKLRLLNIFTIGDLANADTSVLQGHFGVNGIKMQKDAQGVEEGCVLKFDEKAPVKSVGNGITTRRDIASYDDARTVIEYLADTVGTRLRSYGLVANGVSVCIRGNDLNSFVRQKPLLYPTSSSDEIAKECFALFKANYDFAVNIPVRTLTISAFHLMSENASFQTSMLYGEKLDKEKGLGDAIDKIRAKYGSDAIGKAAFLKAFDLLGETTKSDDDMLPFQRGNK